jgi:hypothetical protein
MNNTPRPFSTISYMSAILIGVILFWSFGRNWLNMESLPVFLAGLIGIALVVLVFGALNIFRNSDHK